MLSALGKVLGALALLEVQRDHDHAAIRLQRDSLRYSYLGGEVIDILVGHHNLGNCLRLREPAVALVHHLAAALLQAVTGLGADVQPAHEGAYDLRALGGGTELPVDVAGLCSQVADVPGVELARKPPSSPPIMS